MCIKKKVEEIEIPIADKWRHDIKDKRGVYPLAALINLMFFLLRLQPCSPISFFGALCEAPKRVEPPRHKMWNNFIGKDQRRPRPVLGCFLLSFARSTLAFYQT